MIGFTFHGFNMDNYIEAKKTLDNIPLIFIRQYLIESGYIVRKEENKPNSFNSDAFKV